MDNHYTRAFDSVAYRTRSMTRSKRKHCKQNKYYRRPFLSIAANTRSQWKFIKKRYGRSNLTCILQMQKYIDDHTLYSKKWYPNHPDWKGAWKD